MKLGLGMLNNSPLKWLIAFEIAILWANAVASEPVPTFYEEAGDSSRRNSVNQSLNEQIDPFTGKLQLHYVDLTVPGNGGLNIVVQRSYNSLNSVFDPSKFEFNPVGMGWSMHFGKLTRRANIAPCATNTLVANAPVMELPDGSKQVLYLNLDWSGVISPSRWTAKCDAGFLTVLSPDGMQYEMKTPFSGSGSVATYYTTRMIDRNGNTLNFSYVPYAGELEISQVTSSDGRVVDFKYVNGRLSSVEDNAGRTWLYKQEYVPGAGQPFLTEVKRPDGSAWKYSYYPPPAGGDLSPNAYQLADLTYPTGGKVSYTYGTVQFNRMLPKTTVVSSKTGMGGTWMYSFNPATKMAGMSADGKHWEFTEDEMADRTYVIGPGGTQYFIHVGANSVTAGGLYAIGVVLASSKDAGYENESNSWTAQKISNSAVYPLGSKTIYEEVHAPLLSRRYIDRNGQTFVTRYADFDQYGNARSVTETGTETRTTQITYQAFPDKWLLRLPSSQTVDTIGTTSWTYDANGNKRSETKYGVKTEFTYDTQGNIQTKTDARHNTITYADYFRGIPRREDHPEGVTIKRQVDDGGNILSVTDGEDAKTEYRYDRMNRITQINHPQGNVVKVTWSPNERQVQRGSYVETTSFDAYGRVVKTAVSGGNAGTITQTYQYDPLGRQFFASYPNSSRGTYSLFDGLGRTYAVYLDSDNKGVATGGSRTSYFQPHSVVNVNENHNVYVNDYRAYGDPDGMELVAVQAPISSASMTLTLNGLGQPLSIEQGGISRTNTYDANYFLKTSYTPENGTTTYGRDEVGNMTSRQVGTSGVTTYTYDARNRVKTVTYPAGTPSVTKTYYRDDALKSVDNGLARREFTYTPNKKLSRETLQVDGKNFGVDYAYDGNDALKTQTFSTGLTIGYSPDALGWPTQATPFASAVSFHPNGLAKQIIFGNGVVSEFGLDSQLRPTTVYTRKGDGSQLLNLTQTYDKAGNVTKVVETVAGLQNRTFGYDSLDRLTNVDIPSAGVSGGLINYDGRGNILSKQFGSFALSYQYDASNRLQSVSGSRTMAMNYDTYGNVISNTRNQFLYDDALNMQCSDCGTSKEVRHLYDGDGVRVKTQSPTGTTYFMYGKGGDLLFEMDATGLKREYGYVAGRNIAKKESN